MNGDEDQLGTIGRVDHDLDLSGMGPSLLTRLAIDTMESWGPSDPRIEDVRQLVVALAHAAASIDLRLARVCCFIQQQDLRVLGYSSFGAFIREELDWQPSWQRQLARLLRSDLDAVKRAVISGAITLTAAVHAPGQVGVDDQQAWLRAVIAGEPGVGPPRRGPEDDIDVLTGDDAATVRRARRLARLLLGRPVPSGVADDQMLEWFERGALPAELLDAARQAPPPPDLSPASWPDAPAPDDPATVLLGPWRDPRDLDDALEMTRPLLAARRRRRGLLGRLLDAIKDCWLCLDWGYDRFDDWVRADLDLSPRSAHRLRKAGRTLLWHREIAAAVDQGLSLERAQALGRLVDTAAQAREWLLIVEHLPMAELQQAAGDWQDAHARRRRYARLLPEAPALVEQAIAQRQARLDAAAGALPESGASATGLAGWAPGAPRLGPEVVGDDTGSHLDEAAIRVASHPPTPDASTDDDRVERWLFTAPGVLDAARWLLDVVNPPRQRGCGRMKEHQGYTCQNPECRRRSLRNHVHHDQPRALGGTDDDDNLRCLCPSCHLRLVHGGFMAVERVGDAHVYLFPGRAVVVC